MGNLLEIGKGHAALSIAMLLQGEVDAALENAFRSQEVQEESGYLAGRAFATGALSLCYYASRDRDRMLEGLRELDELTSQLGVYHFLSWLYHHLCEQSSNYRMKDFDWLPESPLYEALGSVKSCLADLRQHL